MDAHAQTKFISVIAKGLDIPETRVKVGSVSAGSAVVATAVGLKDSKTANALAIKVKDTAALAGAIKEAGLGECEISEPLVTDEKQAEKEAKEAARLVKVEAKRKQKEDAAAAKLAEKEAKEAAKKEAKQKKAEEAATAKLTVKEAKGPFTVAFDVTLADLTVCNLLQAICRVA